MCCSTTTSMQAKKPDAEDKSYLRYEEITLKQMSIQHSLSKQSACMGDESM